MIPKSNSCHIYLKICITIQFEGTDYEYNRPEACNFIEKDTLAQVFSCEFYEIFKNNLVYRIPPVTAYIFLFPLKTLEKPCFLTFSIGIEEN